MATVSKKFADDSRGAARKGVDFEKEEEGVMAKAAKVRAACNEPGNKDGVVSQVVDIYSDGTRMSGTVWRPDTGGSIDLPAVLLCHGWGGLRGHLDFAYAKNFAKEGFVAMTFDYRGWGDSDGVLVSEGPQPKPDKDGCATLRARVVRRVVDPEWQVRDAVSALSFLRAMPGVDPSRIALWGSSLGGGHVIKMGGFVKHLACIVAQIGSIDVYTNWIQRHPTYRGEDQIEHLAGLQAKGEAYPWTIENPYGLNGSPNLPKVVFEHDPLQGAATLTAPTLIIAAEEEDLFPNAKNSEAVYQMLQDRKIPSEIAYMPGKHYDAYNPKKGLPVGLKKAVEWLHKHLEAPKPKL